MADGYNSNKTNNSAQFSNEIREQVKKGIGRGTRGRGLRYLAGIKHSQQVEMPPKQAPKFKLGNFAGSALAELNALNAPKPVPKPNEKSVAQTRKEKRNAILAAAKQRGIEAARDPAFSALPVVNFSNNKTNAEIFGESPAENLGNKQNGMAANAELNNLLGGLPLANAPGAPAAGKRKLEKWTTDEGEVYYYDPEKKQSMWNLPSGNVNVVNGTNNSQAPMIPAGQTNTASNNTGTGSVVGKNIKQQINLKAAAQGQAGVTNVGGESLFANNPYNMNFKNRKANNNNSNNTKTGSSKEGMLFSGNIQRQLPLNNALGGQARATNVGGTSIFNTNATAAPAALVGNAPGEVISTNSTFIEGKSVVPDFQVKIRDGSIVAKNGEVTVVATSLEKMPAGFGFGSGGMGLSMPGMPSMPKFSMPRFSGPKIDLSWLKLPNFGHFKLPETDIKGMLGKFLAALPSISRDQILSALKKGGKFIGLVLLSPLLLAAWLYDHGFNLNIKLDGLTGGLISLEDFFLGGNQPAVKEIGRKLKMATDIAKRVVTNTIAEQEFLQKQINDKTRTAESVKQQILASLDSQIANIKSTLANLSADIKQVTVDPEYDNLIDEIDFEGYKGNNSKSANANLMAELNLLLDSIQKAYEGMALGEEATVAQKNVEKFKQIRKNFDDMLSLPQKMRDQLKDAPASAVGAKLKELGRDARSRTAKLGYNVGQFFSRGASRVASMFGRGQTFSNANRTRKNAVAPRNNVQYTNNPIVAGEKKPTFFNRLKGFGSRAAGFFSRKKSPNVAAASRGLNAYKGNLSALMPKPRAKFPDAAAAARTRKNRRYNH